MHTLHLGRVGLLLRHQALLYGRKTFVWLAPTLLVLLGTAYLNAGSDAGDGNGDAPFFAVWFGFLALVGGFFATCAVLRENRTADGRQSFLTLPASDTEKFLANYLWSGPIFFLGVTLAFWLVSLVANALVGALGYPGFAPFDLFSVATWWTVSAYFLLVHPLAFLGAIAFDTAVAPKTGGVLLAALAALGLIGVLTFRVVFADAFEGLFTQRGRVEFAGESPFAVDPVWGFGHLAEALFALLLLTAAYFRFHEKEV